MTVTAGVEMLGGEAVEVTATGVVASGGAVGAVVRPGLVVAVVVGLVGLGW